MTVIYMLPKIAEMRRKVVEVRRSKPPFMCAKPAVGASRGELYLLLSDDVSTFKEKKISAD